MGGGGMFLANSEGQVKGVHFLNQIRRPEVFGLAGLRFRLSDAIALDITTAQHYPFSDAVDNTTGANDKLYDRFPGTYRWHHSSPGQNEGQRRRRRFRQKR